MKVSLNYLKEFTDIKISIDELVEKIGMQLGAVDQVECIGEKYSSALCVDVINCQKHPDADKLSVCLIDDGQVLKHVERNTDGLIQVVCGASNVKAGMSAVWLPPNSVVPNTFDKDPFTLEVREIRGVKSNGMLASAKELAIGDSHEGILGIDEKAKAGTKFSEIYKLDDCIIDIENKMFTHRPDLFGILGIAREVAGIQQNNFKSPSWYKEDVDLIKDGRKNVLPLKIENSVPELVPRFCAVAIKDIKIAESPVWLKTYLSRLGIRPINNIVDLTNYIMLLSAQPLHAYDYDKVLKISGKPELGARLSEKGEKLALLNGKTLELDEGAVVITAGKTPIGLGGVMGGAETEVDENTTNVILECASFDMNLTRKTAMKYGLFTDAVTRFTKNQSARQNKAVLVKAVNEARGLAGGRVASEIIDNNHSHAKKTVVKTSADFINARLGFKLSPLQIKKILENVEFTVEVGPGSLAVAVPFWRTDIEIAEDIVEEVGRLYGYQRLSLELPKKEILPTKLNSSVELKASIRVCLAGAGANEVVTYSFVDSSLLQKAGQDPRSSYHIKNALSPALQYYRQSLTPSLLEKVHPNIKQGYSNFALFEIGKINLKTDPNKLQEQNSLALVVAADKNIEGAAYFKARRLLDYLIQEMANQKLKYVTMSKADNPQQAPYDPTRSALLITESGKQIGIIGEFKESVLNSMKLPPKTAGFEIDLELLEEVMSPTVYAPLNKYPEISQDITLRVASGTIFSDVESVLYGELTELAHKSDYIFHIEALGIFQESPNSPKKNVSFRIKLAHPEKTLTTDEVNKIFDKLEVSAKQKVKAERV